MNTMAEVLAAHRFTPMGKCACGAMVFDPTPENLAEHVADELTKAGYGKLAGAWDEGQKSGMRHADRVIAADRLGRPELPGPPSPNPYGSAS